VDVDGVGGGNVTVTTLAAYYDVIEWSFAALVALGVALAVLKLTKLGPLWALLIGMLVFTGLQFPLKTHAVKLDMPRNSN